MRTHPSHHPRFPACLLGIASLLFVSFSLHATSLYWDSNGNTTGAGATPTGIWGTSLFWNNVNTGLNGTRIAATTSADDLFFSAGTDAINPYTVGFSAGQAAKSIRFQSTGTATLSNATPVIVSLYAVPSTTVSQLRVDSGVTAVVGTNVNLMANAANYMWINSTVVAAAVGTLTIENGGTVSCTNTGVRSVLMDGAGFVVNVNAGGTLSAAGNQVMTVGQSVGSSATLNVQGGTVITGPGANSVLVVGNGGVGVVNLASGSINMVAANTAGMILGNLATAGGTLNLNGGVLNTTLIKTVSGTNSVFNFNGGTLKALINQGTFMTGLTSATVKSGGAIIDDNGFAITIGQALLAGSPSGGLTKLGAGTLTLTGANTYSGGTIISNGTVKATSLGSGDVTVQSGAALGAGSGNTAATLSLGGNLTLNDSVLSFDVTNIVTADKIVVAGNLTPNGVTTISLPNASPLVNGNYTLLEVNGTLGGSAANFTVASPFPKTYAIVYQAGTPNRVVLQVSGLDPKTWVGDGLANQWDINSSLNWVITGGVDPMAYVDNDWVTFDDTSTNLTVDLTAMVSPGSLTINTASNYVFGGVGGIAGTNGLTKSGAGSLTLLGTNTYTGVTTISAGTLSIGDGGTSGSIGNSAGVVNNGALVFNRSDDLAYANEISGTGSLTKTNAGTLTLSGVNTYSGATTVRGGALTLSGNRTANSGALSVGVDANLATLNLQAGNFSFGGNGLNVGNGAAGTNAIVNHSGGDISFTSGTEVLIGNGTIAGNVGVYNMSGGSITGFASGNRGILLGVNSDTYGIFNLSGSASLNLSSGCVQIGRSEGSSTPNNTGGTFFQSGGSASIGTLALGSKAGGTGGSATLTLVGGTFTNSNFARLCLGTDTATITIGGTADVTLPAFPTTRGSGSTVTLAFDGGTLRPYAASAAYLSNLTQVTLTANGANFNVDSNKDITIPQALGDAPSEAGVLTKAGAGTLTLTGANAYSGGTVASEGTLLATSLGSGNVAVASGAKLGAGAGNAVATLSVGGDLTLNNSELLFDINSVVDGDKIQVAGALTPTGVTTITLSNVIPLANGDYTLLEVTGALGGSPASFTVASPSPKTYSIVYQTGSPNRVILQVSGPIASKSWLGDGVANQWDINTSLNWVETGSTVPLIAYQDNDAVLFDDTTTNLNVDITTTVSPASVTVISTNSYTFSGAGAIAGTNSLVKNGSGTLRIANANSYAGGTTLQGPAGTQLALANSAAIGTGPLALKSSVTSSAVTVVLANGITVTNAIVMDSTTGREAFLSTNGNNTLSGPITITGAGNNHLYFNNSGDPGSLLAISNSISGPAHTGGISFRGLAGNYGLVAGQVNIAGVFQLNGAATWTVASTNNSWTTTIIQGANGGFTLGDNDALATTAKVNWGNDTSGALDLAGFSQTIAGLDCAVTPNMPTVGNSSTNSDSLLKINGGGYTFVGQLVDTLGAGTKKLSVELLSGTQTLSGTNTYTGSTTISGGTLTEGATGFIADTSPLTINGASAVFNLGASHNDTVGTVTLANGAITGSGTSTLTVNTGGTFEMQNGTVTGVTLGGAVALNKTTSGTVVISKAIAYTGGTTISDGVLQSGVANVFGADPGKNVVINSPGILDVNGKGTYINALSGDGTVDNTAATALTLQLGRNNGGGTFSGLIQNSGGGDLTLWKWGTGTVTLGGTNTYSGYTWCIAGVLSVNSISSYSSPAPSALGQPTNATGGLIKMVNNGGTGNATLRYTGPTATTDRPIDLTGSTGGGILDASGTGPITFTSDFAASGAGSKSLTLTGANTDANTIAGKVVDNSAVNTTALVKAGVGTWVIGANQDYTGGTFVNNGTLVVNGNLLSSANAVTVAGGTLSGNGTIAGPVAVNAGATLAPGNGLGALTINNTLTLDAASTTAIELNAGSNSSDLVQGVTSLTYGGTLQVTNVSGVLTNGQTFQLFSAASKTGAFSATNLPALSGGLAWNWDSASGTLSVITGIAQTPTNITFSVSGGTLSLSWPASHLGWFAQSNSVALADTNFWFDIAGSETVTNLSYSIDGSLTNVFYRLHKP